MKIKLICMPFDFILDPNLAVSLLSAAIQERGHHASVSYYSMAYAQQVDSELYQAISISSTLYYTLVGEWIFSSALGKSSAGRYLEILKHNYSSLYSDKLIKQIIRLRKNAPDFIDGCFSFEDWSEYDLVAFTTRFQTLNASLALSRKIKKHHPDIPILFGGINTQSHQGIQIIKSYDFLDYVCVTEGEQVIESFLDYLENTCSIEKISGLAWRSAASEIIVNPPHRRCKPMDNLPIPNFSDYFENQKKYHQIPVDHEIFLPLQLSRGCIWRDKIGGCTFCTIDYDRKGYRHKSTEKVLVEIESLSKKYKLHHFRFDDDLAPPNFLEIITMASQKDPDIQYSISYKANVTKETLACLKASGCKNVFIGVESFNNHILKLMNKGITKLYNIRAMKYCAELGLPMKYLLIVGMPDETQQDYEEMYHLMPKLFHLRYPADIFSLSLMNYSPHYFHPEKYGIENIRIPDVAKCVYVYEKESDLINLIPFYDFDYADGQDRKNRKIKMLQMREAWQIAHSRTILAFVDDSEIIKMIDTRSAAKKNYFEFRGLTREVLLACEDIISFNSLHKKLNLDEEGQENLKQILGELMKNNLVVSEGNRYLSLAVNLGYRISTKDLAKLNAIKLQKLAEMILLS